MKIVIDIDDHEYIEIKEDVKFFRDKNMVVPHLYKAIINGTPLPKGHGDLKDMNDLCYKSRYGCKGNCDYLHTCDLYDAPTIIEADKESENE